MFAPYRFQRCGFDKKTPPDLPPGGVFRCGNCKREWPAIPGFARPRLRLGASGRRPARVRRSHGHKSVELPGRVVREELR
jgi:hypothetical protein